MIELRSDTFTLPPAQMLSAMGRAPLGDDVYGEDPTVARLERLVAERLGKEASCLMPSGTMANLAAILAQAPRGSKILVGAESDIYLYEAMGASVCGGVGYEAIVNQADGTLALADLEAALPEDSADPQFALPALICLENTQNRCGGVVLTPQYEAQVAAFASQHGLKVHLDGARLFNASIASGRSPAQVCAYADSVQFCLSKGLRAPIGSMVAGGGAFIESARRIRKMLGGGMRQAGVVAAAGIVALEEMVDRLAEDHRLAQEFAAGLAGIAGVEVLPVQTNIVLFRVPKLTPEEFVVECAKAGVRLGGFGHGRIRAVTHADVSRTEIADALQVIEAVLRP